MSNADPDYTDEDILRTIRYMRSAGHSHLAIVVNAGRIVSVDVTVKTRSPHQLERLALKRISVGPQQGTA